MKKGFTVILLSFLVFGMMMNSYFALADDNLNSINVNPSVVTSGYGSDSGYVGPTSTGENSGFQNQINAESMGMNPHIEGDYAINGSRVHIEREIENEDGNVTIIITKTIIYANGSQVNYTIQINTQNQSGVLMNTMNMERDGEDFNVSVEDGLNVTDHFFGNQSQIMANLSNGSAINITILPDQALNIAFNRLRIAQQLGNNSNYSIQLREKVHSNIPRVIYNIEADKPGKFLGIFKMNMNVSTEIDPETGQVVAVNQPWWAYLVSSETNNQISGNGTVSAPMIPANTTNSS